MTMALVMSAEPESSILSEKGISKTCVVWKLLNSGKGRYTSIFVSRQKTS